MLHSRDLRAVVGLMRAALGLAATEGQVEALSAADPNAVVRIASAHAVLPLLARAAGEQRIRDLVGPELGVFLAQMHKANSARNLALREQLQEIGTALDAAGIRGVALKGAVELLAPSWPDGTRYIGDLDILVPEDRLTSAFECLGALGYAYRQQGDPLLIHHHLPALWHAGRPTAVELHFKISTRRADRILPASLIIAEARPTDMAGLAVPSPRCRLLHLVAHAQADGPVGKPRRLSLRDVAGFSCLGPLLSADDRAFARAQFEAAGALSQWDGFCATARILLHADDERAVPAGAAGAWAAEALGDLQVPGRVRARYLWSWLTFYARRFCFDRAVRQRYLRRLSDRRELAAMVRRHSDSLRNIA
ncbi:MAG: nucleotidyltransferase family protein [Hyphomicrobiaceae bacterium]|nr:nucleotidyltransferase family protein [Hyphomicrobiaceae bacterium]